MMGGVMNAGAVNASSPAVLPPADNRIILAEGLRREYRLGRATVAAVSDVDLTLTRGEFVALMGASGCGKSTLLHLLGCLDTPSAGRYRLEGREVSGLTDRERARLRNSRLGFVFQNFFLLPNLSAQENVALPLLYSRTARDVMRQADIALEQVGLAERRRHRPMELSGGERQRVAIARALVSQPVLLLADEPTGNLDSATGAEVLAVFTALWQAGLTILLVTHDAQVANYAQRILHMRDGQIIAEERPHEAH